MQVRGDAFLARVFDDGGDGFDRQDLLVSGKSRRQSQRKAAWRSQTTIQTRQSTLTSPVLQRCRARLSGCAMQQRRTGASRRAPSPSSWKPYCRRAWATQHPSPSDTHSSAASSPCRLLPRPAQPSRPRQLATGPLRQATTRRQVACRTEWHDSLAGVLVFSAGDQQHVAQPEQALQQYGRALEADPQLAAARNNRALAHLKLRQFDAAEADATAVLQAQPRNVKALLRRGDARLASIPSCTPVAVGSVCTCSRHCEACQLCFDTAACQGCAWESWCSSGRLQTRAGGAAPA